VSHFVASVAEVAESRERPVIFQLCLEECPSDRGFQFIGL